MNVWEVAKAALKKEVSEGKYRLWIDPITLIEKRSGVILLACPNEFSRKRVKEKYGGQIETALTNATGSEIKCYFETDKTERKATKNIPADPQRELPNISPAPRSERMLQKDMTFDSFVVGSNSDFAFSASVALASKKSLRASALYLLSKTGLGKTHLSQAIGHHVLTEYPTEKIYYVTADDFSGEMVRAFRQNKIDEFKDRYRKQTDVLIIEDIHYLTGKERTQVELALTFDALLNSGKKLIFTSCYLPAEVPKLSKELRSRLACGLITQIDAPDYKTRVKILERKSNGLDIPQEVIRYLAEDLTEDVRQLESGLVGVVAKSSLLGEPINMNMAESIVRNIRSQRKNITVDVIKKVVCKYYGLTETEIVSKSRKQRILHPRQIAIYLARIYTDLPLQKLGGAFNRNHATALHSLASVEREVKGSGPVKRQIEYLCDKLESGEKI